jgi:hypothetical protein
MKNKKKRPVEEVKEGKKKAKREKVHPLAHYIAPAPS